MQYMAWKCREEDMTSGIWKVIKKSKKNTKGIRLVISEEDEISIDCYIIALYGYSVIEVAKAVQEAVTSMVESTTGRKVLNVNVSISGISLPRSAKK